MEERILALHADQLGALLNLVGPAFALRDLEEVVAEIRQNGHNSLHIDVLVDEAPSKDKLLWWLEWFEDANRQAA